MFVLTIIYCRVTTTTTTTTTTAMTARAFEKWLSVSIGKRWDDAELGRLRQTVGSTHTPYVSIVKHTHTPTHPQIKQMRFWFPLRYTGAYN